MECSMPNLDRLLEEYAAIEKRRTRRWWLVAPVFILLIGSRPLMEAASFGRGPAAEAPIITAFVFIGLAIMVYVFVKSFQDNKQLKALAAKIGAARESAAPS